MHPRRAAEDQSSLATQIGTETIVLDGFLRKQRVSTVCLPAYAGGKGNRQAAKHIVMLCPLYDIGSRSDSVGAPAN